eukprot:3295307-Amphidinium_carterae.1
MTAGQGKEYQESIQSLRKQFTFGKWEGIRNLSTPRVSGGRALRQLQNGDVEIDVTEYVSKVSKIVVDKARSKCKEEMANEAEVHEFRRVIGALLWAARCGAWQVLGEVTMLSGFTTKLQ